jgi:hypothetical protein
MLSVSSEIFATTLEIVELVAVSLVEGVVKFRVVKVGLGVLLIRYVKLLTVFT